MGSFDSTTRRDGSERVRAWLVTGPLGHLWSVLADVGLLWGRWLLSLARERQRTLAGAGKRSSKSR